MKITNVELFWAEIPLIPLADGGISPYCRNQRVEGRKTAASYLFKVKTDEGLVGWGELNYDLPKQIVKSFLKESIIPKIKGMNPFYLNQIIGTFREGERPQLNSRGLQAGIEVACWDIMGKSVGKPIYELLGGKVRDFVNIAYCMGSLDFQKTEEKVKQIKSEGYKTIKTKGGEGLYFDTKRAEVMRTAGGDELEIRVDVNGGYDVSHALRYLKQVENFDLQYIEQPIMTNNLEGLKVLRQRTKTPIAINEDCYIPNNLFQAIKHDCIDIAVVDYEQLGGLSGLVRVNSIAQEARLPLVHHCSFDMGIKLAAILHATCALLNFTYAIDSTYFAHASDIIKCPIKVTDGKYYPPEGPGLGIEVDESKLLKI